MSYKIVVDSGCDLPVEYRTDSRFEFIPLIMQLDDHVIVDDDTFNQKEYLELVAASEDCPKTACPSPDLYMNSYRTDADDVYVVTLHPSSAEVITVLFSEKICITKKLVKRISIFSIHCPQVAAKEISLSR